MVGTALVLQHSIRALDPGQGIFSIVVVIGLGQFARLDQPLHRYRRLQQSQPLGYPRLAFSKCRRQFLSCSGPCARQQSRDSDGFSPEAIASLTHAILSQLAFATAPAKPRAMWSNFACSIAEFSSGRLPFAQNLASRHLTVPVSSDCISRHGVQRYAAPACQVFDLCLRSCLKPHHVNAG